MASVPLGVQGKQEMKLENYLYVEAKCIGLYDHRTEPDIDSPSFGTENGVQTQLVGWMTDNLQLLTLHSHVLVNGVNTTSVRVLACDSVVEGLAEAKAEHERLVASHSALENQ